MMAAPRFVRWLLGGPGMAVAVIWGFAEGTLFFIVPDVFLTLTAMFSIRRSLLQMAGVTAGAVAAGTLMYGWSARGAEARSAVLHVPFVTAAMIERVDAGYTEVGPWAMVRGPLSGIPYKVYAVEAPGRISPWVFLMWSVPARLERFLITWGMFAAFGIFARRRRREWWRVGLVVHGVYWCGVYAVYWTVI